jgi:hypothetical protein
MNSVARATELKACAVPNCALPVSYPDHLCAVHRLPGLVFTHKASGNAILITVWYAERGDEAGLIYLDDLAIGHLFGGRAGFEARLAKQGFTRVRNITRHAQLNAKPLAPPGKQVGKWSGRPWLTHYPWEQRSSLLHRVNPSEFRPQGEQKFILLVNRGAQDLKGALQPKLKEKTL